MSGSPSNFEGFELSSSVSVLKGVGPKLARLLEKKGLETIEDVLFFVPRDYEDRRRITPIRDLVEGTTAVVFGKVTDARTVGAPRFGSRFGGRGGGQGFQVTLDDGTGRLQLYWFRSFPSLAAEFPIGAEVLCYGPISRYGLSLRMAHPEHEATQRDASGKVVPSPQFGRIVPVYSEAEGLGQKVLRRIAAAALRGSMPQLDDPLPAPLLRRHDLPPLRESLIHVHYPPELPPVAEEPVAASEDELLPLPPPASPELQRLIFEECFLLQMALRLRRDERRAEKGMAFSAVPEMSRRFAEALPFPFTGDQKKAIAAVSTDLARSSPMVRLLQGDVGAGKTVVALAAAVQAAANGGQTVILAPTEVLAQQHQRTAEKFLADLRLPVALLTASTSADKKLQAAIANGDVAVVVGTHAVFQESVQYKRLGVVVVDEQHRFGVSQRSLLLKKAKDYVPHLLMMTATPIPRTLALTQFGDLDVSILREKPAGRQPIETRIVPEKNREKLYATIRETLARGEQAYVIYPLVEESEKLDLKSATTMYEELSDIFPEFTTALVHGKLSAEAKDEVLGAFRDGTVRLLVSTTVVEVGIDVPNATLMVIEHPERLGLSQLHQLRGRVGRGGKASQCLLVSQGKATRRLRVLVRTEDGFEIAEEDLKIRGPGEFLGLRQSGLPGFRLADVVRDANLLAAAREEADAILDSDPGLKLLEHQAIAKALATRWRPRLDRLRNG